MKSRSSVSLLLAAISAASFVSARSYAQAPEPVDLTVLHQIKTQAFHHSQVMDTLFHISDVYGPRITDSLNHKASAECGAVRRKACWDRNSMFSSTSRLVTP